MKDENSSYTYSEIVIKPHTANVFENKKLWEKERDAIRKQYLDIIRNERFKALEWYTDNGGHYIFHPSVKDGDWQLSFIDNKGIPTSDSQYKDDDIGKGIHWADPILEFPYSKINKTVKVNVMFDDLNKEREDMEEYLTSIPKEKYPKYAILQLSRGKENLDYKRYREYDSLKKDEKPNGDDYEMIYYEICDSNDVIDLEKLYSEFNSNKLVSSDYYGHSLSVSDVVLVSENGEDVRAYFCDRFGFKELENDFITKKIQDRFDTGITIRKEYNLLNELNPTDDSKERLEYIDKEYETIFKMADKRKILEETEMLNTVYDYELLYGGDKNADSITVFNHALNRTVLKENIFEQYSAEEIYNMVKDKYFEALAELDSNNEELNYNNLQAFQKGDILRLGNGHSVEIVSPQKIIHDEDLPFPTTYKGVLEIPQDDIEVVSFSLKDVDYVERDGETIIEPPFKDDNIREVTHGEKSKINFFVAEAMEFPTLGKIYENIPTIEEAIEVYEKIHEKSASMGNGICAMVDDEEVPLFENSRVNTLERYPDDVKNSTGVKNAIEVLNNYVSDKRIQSYEDKGFVFWHKEEYSDKYKRRLAEKLLKYSEQKYSNEATVYLAQAECKYNINVNDSEINTSMSIEELKNVVNRQATITEFTKLYDMDYVVFDVETTGVDKDDEIIELAIVDRNGKELYNKMFKPNKEINEEASKVNGISMSELYDKDSFGKDIEKIAEIIMTKPLVSYNKEFDARLFLQSMEAHKEDIPNFEKLFESFKLKFNSLTYCAMNSYTAYQGYHKPTKLIDALKEQGINKIQNHRAIDDCRDVVDLINAIAKKEMPFSEVNREFTHGEESQFVLHIQYKEPKSLNGFIIEKDSISFGSQEEMKKYINGDVAYNILDDSVKRKDDEILLYAEDSNGKVVWKQEDDLQKENNKIKDENKMEDKTSFTEKEELSVKDQLMQKLADGIKNTLDSERFADWCKKQGRLYYNNYSLRNALLTYLQKPNASYVCGYEKWKDFGRQVKQGAKGIKVLAPAFVKEYGAKGSLLTSIKKACNEQLKKNSSIEYASFRLGQSKLSFQMYKNGLFDVKVNDDVIMPHITEDELRKFLDMSVIGKVPAYYNAITVFDVADTTDEVEFLWVKDNYKKEELVLDDNGNPIKNKKGQYKIFNSEERKARFLNIDMKINESDNDKMEILYDTLKTISGNKGIPFSETDPSLDKTLNGGALGYYRHPTDEYAKGNIVISSELSPTNKVAVAFHEIAHSDLHSDIEWLKDEMGLSENEIISRQMKETQAEAVAYMTASNFGIETEHKSFEYIANWSNGRELKELEKSFDVIYKESKKLMRDIEEELDKRGLTLAIEVKDKTPMSNEDKLPIVTSYKKIVLDAMRENETIQKNAFDDLKNVSDEVQKNILKEQIVISHNIDKQIAKLNEHVDKFENSSDKQEQVILQYQMKSDATKISLSQTKLNDLSEERVAKAIEKADMVKSDMKSLFISSPYKAMEQLQKDYEQMKDLTSSDLKYLASSKFISREYSKFLGADNEKFIELATKQLENMKKVMSKNKTAVEISFCEQWGENPIFKSGTVAHPKLANKIIAQAEKQTQIFKKKAEEENDYYPYSKCFVTIYSMTDKDKMTVLNTRVDIGDSQQKDLSDHLSQICSKGAEKQSVLEKFVKSTKERTNILLLTPQDMADRETCKGNLPEVHNTNSTLSMQEWKNELASTSCENSLNENNVVKENDERGKE